VRLRLLAGSPGECFELVGERFGLFNAHAKQGESFLPFRAEVDDRLLSSHESFTGLVEDLLAFSVVAIQLPELTVHDRNHDAGRH